MKKKKTENENYKVTKWILDDYGIVNEVKDGIVVVKEGLNTVRMSEMTNFEKTGMKGIVNFLGKEKAIKVLGNKRNIKVQKHFFNFKNAKRLYYTNTILCGIEGKLSKCISINKGSLGGGPPQEPFFNKGLNNSGHYYEPIVVMDKNKINSLFLERLRLKNKINREYEYKLKGYTQEMYKNVKVVYSDGQSSDHNIEEILNYLEKNKNDFILEAVTRNGTTFDLKSFFRNVKRNVKMEDPLDKEFFTTQVVDWRIRLYYTLYFVFKLKSSLYEIHMTITDGYIYKEMPYLIEDQIYI